MNEIDNGANLGYYEIAKEVNLTCEEIEFLLELLEHKYNIASDYEELIIESLIEKMK